MNALRSKILSFLSYFLIAFTVLILVLHFVFGFQYVVILTNSMEPHINPGDLVITMPVNTSKLHPGDVILYRVTIGNSTFRITHRIIGVKTDADGRQYFVTKGDNRKFSDPWRVYPDQILGKVVLVIPKVGLIWPYIPLIVLGLFLLIIALIGYDIALLLLGEGPVRPKSMKADLLAIKRKRIKVYHHKR
ncbi:signal peptidase I [Thermococcus sp.]|uniref:signal peptidase I n=1 Tax=Thermococcus sp. TaxID=35749 RepID=UPI00262F5C24|nr:signal peptidase I [Thermococcus sp.]